MNAITRRGPRRLRTIAPHAPLPFALLLLWCFCLGGCSGSTSEKGSDPPPSVTGQPLGRTNAESARAAGAADSLGASAAGQTPDGTNRVSLGAEVVDGSSSSEFDEFTFEELEADDYRTSGSETKRVPTSRPTMGTRNQLNSSSVSGEINTTVYWLPQGISEHPVAVTYGNAFSIARTIVPSDINGVEDGTSTMSDPESVEAIPPVYENPFRSSTHSPYSTFGIDVDNASYTNVRGYLTRGETPPPSIVRIEEMINYFRYDYPTPTDGRPLAFDSEVVTCPWNREHLLVRLALQGRAIDTAQAPPSNLVFLIDVSGSMSPAYSLPLLRQAFHRLVDQLRSDDRVAIVVYAGASGLALPSTPGSEKEAIHQAIDNLEAGGSTAGGAGIRLAYEVAVANYRADGNNRVILATDGDFNVGITSEKDLVALIEEKRGKGVYLSVLGVGQGNYQDQKMERLADNGNGNYYYLDRIGEAERVLVSEMSGTLYTIAKDVKLQIAFNPEKVAAYRLIGYENRMLAARDFDDDTKDAGELGAGHQVTALYEVVPAGATVGHAVDTANAANDRLDEELPNLFTANDLLRARLRYKKPADSTSNLIEHIIGDDRKEIAGASASTRLAVAVAAWGMSLRGSAYDGDIDPGIVRTWVPPSATDYAELIGLIEKTEASVASSK